MNTLPFHINFRVCPMLTIIIIAIFTVSGLSFN